MYTAWPYIWWLPCQKHRTHTVYVRFWPTLDTDAVHVHTDTVQQAVLVWGLPWFCRLTGPLHIVSTFFNPASSQMVRVGQNRIYKHARSVYIWCMYGVFSREIIKYTVMYGAYRIYGSGQTHVAWWHTCPTIERGAARTLLDCCGHLWSLTTRTCCAVWYSCCNIISTSCVCMCVCVYECVWMQVCVWVCVCFQDRPDSQCSIKSHACV
jgi:hypothetical protein